jgi:hypothetical protein
MPAVALRVAPGFWRGGDSLPALDSGGAGRLGVAALAGFGHDGFGGGPEAIRIGRDIIMCLLCAYHESIRRL